MLLNSLLGNIIKANNNTSLPKLLILVGNSYKILASNGFN